MIKFPKICLRPGKESLESVYSSNSRLNLLNKRKRMSPLDMSQVASTKGDKYVTQRVLSAKVHKVKQLQSQLSDAHYHLQELSNENRVLRAMQKKQEIALQRYENSNAELPTVLNSHSEEMRVQQTKFKQLKQQFKEVSQKLKDRDMQLQQLRDEHNHLLELSRDRNLLEREKLQAQVADLSAKVQQQNETISMLQRRIALETKNFRHQLQQEINKHKDTRHDLDLAINNADKLSTIIEMKEKMLSTAASRPVKSPVKPVPGTNIGYVDKKTPNKNTRGIQPRPQSNVDDRGDRTNLDQLSKICENSRNVTSSLSHDEDLSSNATNEPVSKFRYARSRNGSSSTRSTPNTTRKSSKGSDEILELAKTVQDGMAELSIFDDEMRDSSPDEVQKKMELMKTELMNKIMNDEGKGIDKEKGASRKTSAIRRQSTESIEEEVIEEIERPKSRGRRNSSVSFYDTVEETTTIVSVNSYKTSNEMDIVKPKRESSNLEKKLSGKPLTKYCEDIVQDIEKSSKVIDKHIKQFNISKFESDKLVQQLQVVDKINDFVSNGDIPDETLEELNNNFRMLTESTLTEAPMTRKRSITDRRHSRDSKSSLLGDSTLSNQDLLNDLLGRN